MPKNGRKGGKKNSMNYNCSDIKLEDFANSQVSAVKRKPTVNSLAREVKTLCTLERSWFEKDISEFMKFPEDAVEEEVGDEEDEESELASGGVDGSLALRVGKRRLRCKKRGDDNSCGQAYPLDLWFLISNYISPEDVGVFASLCKASYFVSQTYSFWINIYKRYYKPGSQLPLRLQPHCIKRPHGLKASVIRSLYYFYPRFSVFTNLSSHFTKDVSRVLKHVCVSMWHSQSNNKWFFFFKFQSSTFNPRSNHPTGDRHVRESGLWDTYEYQDPHELMNSVNVNPEEGCSVLKVTTAQYVAFPIVMGAHLADIKFSLTHDMLKHKLQLIFSFSKYRQPCKNAFQLVSTHCGGGTGETLEFDPVDNAIVLDWWHPQYPTGNTFL